MTDLPARDAFAAYLNTPFQVLDGPPEDFTLELNQVSGIRVTPGQETFSILFRAPSEWYLPQRIYHLKHAYLGEFNLFLVPIGQEEGYFVYEAVFNYLTPPASTAGK
jgi:hypothetical protein